jgi:cytoskeletal protein CcmA (bactofilin family)
MFNKFKTNPSAQPETVSAVTPGTEPEAQPVVVPLDVATPTPTPAPAPAPAPAPLIQPNPAPQRNSMMDIISNSTAKPSILSEGFSFRGEIAAKGAIHVEGTLNGQIQVDELTIGSRGQVEGVVTCQSLHIKGKFTGTATCSELIVTSSASVDGHVVYQTLSVQKGASIKGELLLVK